MTFQEEIMCHMDQVFEFARHQFPRLYFLSRDELVSLLSVSRNPRALLPTAKKCFHGIANLTFALPANTDTANINSALDYALNGKALYIS